VDWRPLRHVRFHNAEANLAPATNGNEQLAIIRFLLVFLF